eukprot:3041956-Rhodomonas_salina.3
MGVDAGDAICFTRTRTHARAHTQLISDLHHARTTRMRPWRSSLRTAHRTQRRTCMQHTADATGPEKRGGGGKRPRGDRGLPCASVAARGPASARSVNPSVTLHLALLLFHAQHTPQETQALPE